MGKKVKYKENGITIVALVITIIVLLILAGITIGTLSSKNGVIKNANITKDNTTVASEKTALKASINTALAKEISNVVTEENLQKALDKNYGE